MRMQPKHFEKKRASAGGRAFERCSAVLLLSVTMIVACIKVILVVRETDGVAIYDRNRFRRDYFTSQLTQSLFAHFDKFV